MPLDGSDLPRPGIPPMEAMLCASLPKGEGWQFEPKWDGFRCLAFVEGGKTDLRAKSGKPLGRFFPEVCATLSALPGQPLVLDGELIVLSGGQPDFDALQMRLHPAESRILRLSNETPAGLILFDLLVLDGESLMKAPLIDRRIALERFFGANRRPGLSLSPITRDPEIAEDWLKRSGGATDGVVAKKLDAPYRSGERIMRKVKRIRTADCVVGGFRYLERSRQVGSLLLGLYNEAGELDHVGFLSAIPDRCRKPLTEQLEKLVEPPGFTGKSPGAPSRWNRGKSTEWTPLRPELVVEVAYDHLTGGRFRHGTRFVRWRPDKSASQCTFDQLAEATPPVAYAALMETRAGAAQQPPAS